MTYAGASGLIQADRSDFSVWSAHNGTTTDFDKAGRRKKGKVSSGSTVWFEEQIDYDLNDHVIQVKWPYGRATANETESQRYTFDELGRLTKYEQGKWTASSFTTPLTASHDWTLDEQGNWRKHKDESVTTEWELSVDPVNAYTQWKGWYDLDGNGTNETQGPLTLQYDGVKSFLYERELNPAVTPHPRRALRYLHDGLGRLTRIDKDVGGTITTLVSYGYDTQNRLAWRKEGTNERVWLIYDGGQVIAEQTETTRLKSYVWVGSQLILSRDQGGLELHHHQDRLGSVVLSTRKNGSTTELHGRAQFDPYGRKVKQVGWEANGLGTVYGYAGMRLDDTAKLYVMGHRWYDPEMGRFIEQDPIGESGGYNLYAYVNSSPVMWVDPKGLRPRSEEDSSNPSRLQAEMNSAISGRGGHQLGKWRSDPVLSMGGAQIWQSPQGGPCVSGDADESDSSNEQSPPADASQQAEATEELENARQSADQERNAVADIVVKILTTKGTAEDANNALTNEEKQALAGKHITILVGHEDLPQQTHLPNETRMAPVVKLNAERLQEVLEANGATSEIAPLDRRNLKVGTIESDTEPPPIPWTPYHASAVALYLVSNASGLSYPSVECRRSRL